METPNTRTILNVGLIVAGGIVLYKLGSFLGIFKSAEEKKQDEAEQKLIEGGQADVTKIDLNNGSLSLSPNYFETIYKQIVKDYKKKGKKAPLPSQLTGPYKYSDLATSIYNSKGVFNDNEDKLYGVFIQLKTQLQIAFLSQLFYKIYKRDLLTYILGFTNTEERAKLFNIIKNKPLY